METYAEAKELADNPRFLKQKQKNLRQLTDDMIEPPIIKLIKAFNGLEYCYTLQCCYGHFVFGDRRIDNLDPLPASKVIDKMEYRIAYVAFCIDNSPGGKEFLNQLKNISMIDPENIQLCSAEWFWKRQVNSYALQVEPDRYKDKDKVILSYEEAQYIESVRNKFYIKLKELMNC